MPVGHRRDHAVDQTSRSDTDPAALAIDGYRTVEVGGWVKRQKMEPQEKPAELDLAPVGSSPGQYLHDDGLGDGQRPVTGYEF